jgi:hypothetical protein
MKKENANITNIAENLQNFVVGHTLMLGIKVTQLL